MTLQALVSNNYPHLQKVARRIASRKDYRLAGDLLSETYRDVYEKKSKFPEGNEEFVRWFSKCMHNQFRWSFSEFNKLTKVRETLDIEIQDNTAADPDAILDVELSAEGINEATMQMIEISSSLGKTKTLQYIEVLEFKRGLADYEKILFELYFESRLSTHVIATMYSDDTHKINWKSINKLVKSIKTKIKNYQWKQLSTSAY